MKFLDLFVVVFSIRRIVALILFICVYFVLIQYANSSNFGGTITLGVLILLAGINIFVWMPRAND